MAFCDADGEYAPEELEAMVAPILEGQPTTWSARASPAASSTCAPTAASATACSPGPVAVARRRLTDGQSGYRALSPAAAADAEIVHDFNYAQVLTLDLLAKGFRYAEVPITYRFRDRARSSGSAATWAVVPAVYRELNGGRQSSTTWRRTSRAAPSPGCRRPSVEAVGGGPGHGQGVVGVVLGEQPLAAEGQ